MTLSHRWGKSKVFKLTMKNIDELKAGIHIDRLPKTFREAIDFACRLSPSIRYIWIDSLCIIQDSDDDWHEESVKMYSVYRNSYCNISATASPHSDCGIYSNREPKHLWEDEINLNVEDLSVFSQKSKHKRSLAIEPLIRRCTIQDAAFWTEKWKMHL